MPTEYVKKQLFSLEFAQPTSYNAETNTYFIPKYSGPIYSEGKCYLVRFLDSLTDDLLLSWNNQSIPKTRLLKIIVNTRLGKLLKVDALEVDDKTGLQLNTMWFGWINSDYLEQLSTLN